MSDSTIRVKLNVDEFDRLANLRGWRTIAERSRALGISPAQYGKVRSGAVPGTKFIDSCVRTLRVPYEVLFVRDNETAGV